jgi:hypothetical protein
MGGVGGAAAVAEDENLRPLIPGPAQQPDDARDLFERQRGVGLLLPVSIFHQPLREMRHGSIPNGFARGANRGTRCSKDSDDKVHSEASTSALRTQSRKGVLFIKITKCENFITF